MTKILFVCTSNMFRSMTAEKCLNHFANKNNLNLSADSAAIQPAPRVPMQATINSLFDIEEKYPEYEVLQGIQKEQIAEKHVLYVVDYIYDAIPLFVENLGLTIEGNN